MAVVGKSDGQRADGESRLAYSHGPPLVTQFTPPPPPFGFVERPRLRARLERGLDEPVTLVCGPAGSGKTTLLASALRGRAAWASLEPGDDEPGRFWGAVLTALQIAGAVPEGSALESLAPPVHDSRTAFVPLLVNALAELPEPVVLVLDELQVVRSRECLAQLGFLVLHAPPTLRLVVSARADPALPLHVLRVRGRLVEIRAADLAFDEAEAAELMGAHGLELPDRLVRALCARTEGWGAGLRLAALSLQGRSDPEHFVSRFAGDDRAVGDYLLAEVLDRQSPELRDFLLRTSIVDRVCGDLADALTGESSGADMLAGLERTNGFVLGIDQHRFWFRYHRLFAKLLRTRARSELPAGELRELHARAAHWYADHGAESHALRHAVEAEDWDLAVEVVTQHWLELFVRGQGGAIRALVDQLPPERLQEDAELAAALACSALDARDPDTAEIHLAPAELRPERLPAPRRRRYLETMALARLYLARLEGDFEAALAAADTLLTEASGHAGPRDEARLTLVHATLGEVALWAHRIDRAGEELRQAVTLAEAAKLEYVSVGARSHLALLEVLTEGVGGGVEHATAALELAERRGWSAIPQTACAHLTLAISAFFDLKPDEAAEHLARANAVASSTPGRQLHFMLVHLEVRLQMTRGRPEEGLRALDRYEVAFRAGTPPPYERAAAIALRARLLATAGDLDGARAMVAELATEPWLVADVAAARMLLADGEPAAAAERLAAAAEAHERELHTITGMELAVLHAVACDEAGDPAATRVLERALQVAETTGLLWPFVEAGRRMEGLLKRQIRHGTAHRAVVGELLDAFADRAPARHSVAPLLEPLSDREQAILRYLPTTLSNREIAAELFVTTNTVKTHLRSIYRKLDVARRREAVDRARDLRLLSGGGARR